MSIGHEERSFVSS